MIAEDIASELLETTRDELVAIIRKELTSDEYQDLTPCYRTIICINH